MKRQRRCRWCASVALALLAFAGVVALAACGGSSTAASTSPSAAATPYVAATPERLVGLDSVAVTQKAVDAYTAAWDAQSVAQLGRVYARDVVFDCHATGVHVDGREAFLELMGGVFSMTTSTRALAGHAGRGWGVLELRQDVAGGSMQILQLIETRGGKIVRLANYYQPIESQSGPLRAANPLKSAPGPADTPVVAEAVALKYAAALQAKDADAILVLGAPSNAFRDTAGFNSPSAGELTQCTNLFKAPADLAFNDVRYALGRGWAALIWTAFSAGSGGDGATMLEIRNGKIARETLYYNSDRMPF
jgi:ketosteroid isomerase-like protein